MQDPVKIIPASVWLENKQYLEVPLVLPSYYLLAIFSHNRNIGPAIGKSHQAGFFFWAVFKISKSPQA